MKLTDKQQAGLEIALARYKNHEKYTVISGFAGTGKSTLVKFIINELSVPSKKIVYCAYTGKACTVLRQKGNKRVKTLHKLLYKHYPDGHGGYHSIPRLEISERVIVVDECSMMPQKMVNLLLSYPNIYVLFLGDPFQLPPVGGAENALLKTPHVFLDEIMRQALDNEIIKFSMDIRTGTLLPTEYIGNNVQILPKAQLKDGMLLWADQVLCAKNATRISLNNKMRSLYGFAGAPQIGDKVICLKNNWDMYDDDGNALVNGTIGHLRSIEEHYYSMSATLKLPQNRLYYYDSIIDTEEGTTYDLTMDVPSFEGKSPALNQNQELLIARSKRYKTAGIFVPNIFTFGYAITGWKSQGSQYNKVLIYEENFPFDKLEKQRFLYTCITRAVDKAVLLRDV